MSFSNYDEKTPLSSYGYNNLHPSENISTEIANLISKIIKSTKIIKQQLNKIGTNNDTNELRTKINNNISKVTKLSNTSATKLSQLEEQAKVDRVKKFFFFKK